MTTIRPVRSGQRAAFGVAIAAGAAIAYGLSPVLVQYSLDTGIAVSALLLARFVIASFALWLLYAYLHLTPSGRARAEQARRPMARLLMKAAALGFLIYALQVLTFTYALDRIGASLAIMIFYSYPAIIIIGARILGREALTLRRVVAVVVVMTGIVVLAGGGTRSDLDAFGILLALAAAVACAIVTLTTASFVEELHPFEFGAAMTTGATVAFLAAVVVEGESLRVPWDAWLIIIPLAILPSVIGTSLMALGVREAGPSLAGLALTLEPVVAVATAAVFLGESLSPLQLCGGVLVICGIVVALEIGGRATKAAVHHPPE